MTHFFKAIVFLLCGAAPAVSQPVPTAEGVVVWQESPDLRSATKPFDETYLSPADPGAVLYQAVLDRRISDKQREYSLPVFRF